MIEVFTRPHCQFCFAAKRLLTIKGLEFTEINLDTDPAAEQKLREHGGLSGVPQVFIDGRPVGGYQELAQLDRDGGLVAGTSGVS